MKVLVVNAGSSSLKYQLIDSETENVLGKGLCERIGIDGRIEHKLPDGRKMKKDAAMPNHAEAMKILIDVLTDKEYGCISSMDEISAVGHRVVHGGDYFSGSVVVTPDVIAKLENCVDLAPLHTGAHIMGIQGCLEAMPGKPQVLVFDTAFHQTMSEQAYMYGLPYEMYEKAFADAFGYDATPEERAAAGALIPTLEQPNTREADYVWLPFRFDGEMAYLDWHDEWRIEDYE